MAALSRSLNRACSSNVIWRPLYRTVFATYEVTPESVHKIPYSMYDCSSVESCKKKAHYSNLQLVEPKRVYTEYKRAFARRAFIQERDELRRTNPRVQLYDINTRIEAYDKAIGKLEKLRHQMERLRYVQLHGVHELYAFSHGSKPQRQLDRAKKKQKQTEVCRS
jgi:hypothetical protein